MPHAPSEPGSPYRLDELGWLQFDRLCALLLEAAAGVDDLNWHGQSDRGRVAVAQGPLALAEHGVRLQGPVTVAAFWTRGADQSDARMPELAERALALALMGDADAPANEFLVLTNLRTQRADVVLRTEAFVHRRRLVVIGAEQIAASLDRHAELRAALPSVLGLRDLGPLIDREARARSSLDIGQAQELARVFWPTRAYDRARTVLGRHRFVVLTGPPEMGKTAIAQMLALAQMTAGWEAHECTDPDQVWRVFDRARRQIFIADDAFGSTEYRPDSAERWALGLGRLLGALDAEHWLVWTSRPAPLRAGLRRVERERGAERFPAPGQVLVDAADLNLEEKTMILFRHARAQGAGARARRLVRWAGPSIVEHPHFTPERIRRLVAGRLGNLPELADEGGLEGLRQVLQEELAVPTEAMLNSFRALAPEHRDLLIALLDAPAGLIGERELAATVRRHHPGGLSRAPGELIDRLTDHFLRVTALGIGWVHPSWRDLVIEQLRADPPARRRFLGACGVDGVLLAISQQGGEQGERSLPLLGEDADWDQLADRLREIGDGLDARDLARILLALETSLAAIEDQRQRLEAQSLATQLLIDSARAWEQAGRALPAFLLEAWYRLRAQVRERPERPGLSVTWAELHPGAMLLEQPDRAELMRAGEWLAVAQILREHDLPALNALGFFDRDQELLARLIVTLTRTVDTQPEMGAVAEAVLRQIAELVPELGAGARGAITILELAEDLAHRRWWAPEDIPAPPSSEPPAERGEFTADDVRRVLLDL